MTIIFAILLFSLLIFIHELGHFLAAKASGVNLDTRFDFPDKWYQDVENRTIKAEGDVYSRTRLRYKEIKQSFHIIKKFLKKLEEFESEQ